MTLLGWLSCRHEVLGRLERIEQMIVTKGTQIMADITTLTADFNQYKTDVGAAFGRLQASLDAALAAQGIPADVQAQMDALDATIKGADTEANAVDPAPVAPSAG